MNTIVSNIVVFSDSTGHGNQGHLVYATNQARWWLFYIDTKTATTVKTMVSSSNDLSTATWSAGTASPAFPTSRALSTNDQRNLGVVNFANGSTDVAHVSVGIQATASIGYREHIRATFTGAATITWESWGETASASTVSAPSVIKGNSLGVSSLGTVHEATNVGSGATTSAGVNGDPNARVSTNNDTTGTWTTGFGSFTSVDDGMAFQCNTFAFAPLASGAMILLYENSSVSNSTGAGLKYNSYTSGTTWPNNTGGADVAIGTTTQDENDWCLCSVNTTHVYAFRRDTTTAIKCRMYSGSAWSTPVATVPTFPGTTIKAGSGLFAATDGTSLWLFAIDSATNNPIYYVKGSTASGTITFGSWTLLEAAGSAARNFISGCLAVGNSQIGVIYTVVNGSNFDIALSTLSVAGGGGTTNQTPAQVDFNGGLGDPFSGGITS